MGFNSVFKGLMRNHPRYVTWYALEKMVLEPLVELWSCPLLWPRAYEAKKCCGI